MLMDDLRGLAACGVKVAWSILARRQRVGRDRASVLDAEAGAPTAIFPRDVPLFTSGIRVAG